MQASALPAMASEELDESALGHVLAFINEPRARVCCRAWSEDLYRSLQLEHRIRFRKALHQKGGKMASHQSAVRSFGEDFEECVAYQFDFDESGEYTLMWNCSFGQWSAANERQVGRWTVVGNMLRLESTQGPEMAENQVRYAPPGRVADIPLDTLLSHGKADQQEAPIWEYQVRGKPIPEALVEKAPAAKQQYALPSEIARNAPPVTNDSRFVEIDGEMYEVSGDIRSTYPEDQWERLMRVRVRFGLMGF
mmetsp:Transcript_21311/g.37900  ORF Transcript_21311/g.37900 Transcript_21311/m.37900 type:complete len:251 (+) Transcript_21311:23-775(+)